MSRRDGSSSSWPDPAGDDPVVAIFGRAQALGMLGDRPIDEVIAHARRFVAALDGVRGRVIDVGTGAGIPGLVIAADRPDLHVSLLDRRRKRTDFLEQMVRRLDWTNRVHVLAADAVDHARSHAAGYDAATARGFGPPETTLRLASELVRSGGRIVISDPPEGDRWNDTIIGTLPVERVHTTVPATAVFHVKHLDSTADA